MCHQHVTIKFGPYVNFIIGQNGSGKSAILAALTICFGGKTSNTQRAVNIKSLIGHHGSSAKVVIKLNNDLKFGFKPEVYGECISIERKLYKESPPTFSIKDCNGHKVSAKKEEVIAICEHFGIQVDNPMAVLTQETAKHFLKSAKPKDLYDFFLIGTQLQDLAVNYEYIKNKITSMESSIVKAKETLPLLERELAELDKKIRDFKMIENLYVYVEDLKKQLKWSYVEEKQLEADSFYSEIGALKETLSSYGSTVSSLKAQIEESRNVLDTSQMQEESRRLANQRKEICIKIEEKKRELNEVYSLEEEINEELKQHRNLQHKLQEKYEEESMNQNIHDQDRRERMEGKIKEFEDKIQKLKEEIADSQQNAEELNTSISDLQEKKREADKNVFAQETKLKNVAAKLKTLELSKKDKLEVYGRNMKEILEDIEKERWETKPVGPIGLHLKIIEPNWTKVVESILGKNAASFVVTSNNDEKKLRRIFQRHKRSLGIFVVKNPRLYDSSDHDPDGGVRTLSRILIVDSDLVKKALLIMTDMNRIALVQVRSEAESFIRQCPRNVDSVYSIDMFKFTRSENGNVSQFSRARATGISFFENYESQLSRLEDIQDKYTSDYKKFKGESGRLTSTLERSAQRSRGLEAEIENSNQEIRQLKREIQAIRAQLSADAPSNMNALQEEMKKIESKIAGCVTNFRSLVMAKNEAEGHLADMNPELESIVEAHEESMAKLKKAHRMAEDRLNENAKLNREIDSKQRQIETKTAELETLETQYKETLAHLHEMEKLALEFCPRIKASKSVDELKKELHECEVRINAKEENGNLESVMAEYEKKVDIFKESKSQVSANQILIDLFHETMNSRKQRWRELRDQKAIHSAIHFVWLLTHRGYNGRLDYNHEEKTLTVKMNFNSENFTTNSLSGGERSFGTMSLLLSLWIGMGNPLRCLDEFDVFMDPVNRKQIIQLIMEFALKDQKQYILITPQPVRGLEDPRIHIVRMRDPERGQRTIG